MDIMIREYRRADLPFMTEIWNQIVGEGNAFPQEEMLSEAEAEAFFAGQTCCGVAQDTESERILGLYILHPNNVGRCGHICNASYGVSADSRGLHIGERLVKDCMKRAKEQGFRLLQFNAVVASNIHARHLYERLGFEQLGIIRMPDGSYEDICPYWWAL